MPSSSSVRSADGAPPTPEAQDAICRGAIAPRPQQHRITHDQRNTAKHSCGATSTVALGPSEAVAHIPRLEPRRNSHAPRSSATRGGRDARATASRRRERLHSLLLGDGQAQINGDSCHASVRPRRLRQLADGPASTDAVSRRDTRCRSTVRRGRHGAAPRETRRRDHPCASARARSARTPQEPVRAIDGARCTSAETALSRRWRTAWRDTRDRSAIACSVHGSSPSSPRYRVSARRCGYSFTWPTAEARVSANSSASETPDRSSLV